MPRQHFRGDHPRRRLAGTATIAVLQAALKRRVAISEENGDDRRRSATDVEL
jgi:hypothetical protein